MSPVELIKVARQCGGKAHAKRVMQSMVHPNSTTTTTVPAVTGNPIQTSMMTTTATRGLNATLLRDGIPHGIWFLAYDICKTSLLQYALFNNNNNNGSSDLEYNDESIRNNNSSNVPVSVSLLSGAVAATVAWAVGYPADLIKTRIQASTLLTHNNNNNTNAAASTTGILETARQIVRESDGRVVAALYRGFAMKLLRSIPASMIGFTVYEGVKRRIEQTF